LLAGSRVGRLALLDADGAPRVLPVTYAISGESLVTAVDHKPKRLTGEQLARVRWLRARPGAALTVDHYEDDWSALAWVQVLGSVRVRDAASSPEAMAALAERYEPYRSDPPAGPLLFLDPARLLWWHA
jgi:PPOX class probable F420-dependent enzyme